MRFSDLWRWEGTIGRGPYALIGLIGFALKHNIDRFVASFLFGREWGPFNYRVSPFGPGAKRYCGFSTGSFVEPIKVWNDPRLLKFSVTSNPPHLEGPLASEGGQFLLQPLDNGGTRPVGTTWYRHSMWPAFYWRWWSDELIHRIHLRVLRHIKRQAEDY